MRALRFLKGAKGGDAEELVWKEWIRVEVVYVERIKKRWEILGIGKAVPVKEDEEKMEVDGEEEQGEKEEEDKGVEVPALPQEGAQPSAVLDQAAAAVETTAVSGQEAIREGAVVRVVLDSCLLCSSFSLVVTSQPRADPPPFAAYSHSIEAYTFVIDLLRTLPSSLRLPLLEHVYTSLAAQHPSSSPSYAAAVSILATRPMHDQAYDPAVPESADLPSLEGEALVDAVGQVVDEYWKACKGKKGKGREREKAPVEVWEAFCQWLEDMEDESDDENLVHPPPPLPLRVARS